MRLRASPPPPSLPAIKLFGIDLSGIKSVKSSERELSFFCLSPVKFYAQTGRRWHGQVTALVQYEGVSLQYICHMRAGHILDNTHCTRGGSCQNCMSVASLMAELQPCGITS
jgi:hypothetical protein